MHAPLSSGLLSASVGKALLLTKAAAIDGGGQIMLMGAALVAYLQGQETPLAGEAGTALAQALIQALAAGGVLYIVVQKLLTEYGKRQDANREMQRELREAEIESTREERQEERAERDRFFEHWTGRIADLNKANADLINRYIEREQRYETQYQAQLGLWKALCDDERKRSEHLVETIFIQTGDKQTVIKTSTTTGEAPSMPPLPKGREG